MSRSGPCHVRRSGIDANALLGTLVPCRLRNNQRTFQLVFNFSHACVVLFHCALLTFVLNIVGLSEETTRPDDKLAELASQFQIFSMGVSVISYNCVWQRWEGVPFASFYCLL